MDGRNAQKADIAGGFDERVQSTLCPPFWSVREGVCEPNGLCLSAAAYEQVRDRLKERFVDLGEKELKNIARPVRAYALKMGVPSRVPAAPTEKPGPPRLSMVVLPFANISDDPEQDHFVDGDPQPDHRPLPDPKRRRDRAEHGLGVQG